MLNASSYLRATSRRTKAASTESIREWLILCAQDQCLVSTHRQLGVRHMLSVGIVPSRALMTRPVWIIAASELVAMLPGWAF